MSDIKTSTRWLQICHWYKVEFITVIILLRFGIDNTKYNLQAVVFFSYMLSVNLLSSVKSTMLIAGSVHHAEWIPRPTDTCNRHGHQQVEHLRGRLNLITSRWLLSIIFMVHGLCVPQQSLVQQLVSSKSWNDCNWSYRPDIRRKKLQLMYLVIMLNCLPLDFTTYPSLIERSWATTGRQTKNCGW